MLRLTCFMIFSNPFKHVILYLLNCHKNFIWTNMEHSRYASGGNHSRLDECSNATPKLLSLILPLFNIFVTNKTCKTQKYMFSVSNHCDVSCFRNRYTSAQTRIQDYLTGGGILIFSYMFDSTRNSNHSRTRSVRDPEAVGVWGGAL